MAFQYGKLRGRIVEKFGSLTKFSNELGTSIVTVSRKMNGYMSFTHNDIVKWCELLEIPKEEIGIYFFS